jgi:serine/threonine protein kinase
MDMHIYIKPDNILYRQLVPLKPIYDVKICDFDHSEKLIPFLEQKNLSKNNGKIKFSPGYVSIEAYNRRNLTLATDLFHLGLLMDVLCRRECHPTDTVLPIDDDQLDIVLNDSLPDYNPEMLKKYLKCGKQSHADIVMKLCDPDPLKRGTIAELIEMVNRNSATNFRDGAKQIQSKYDEIKEENGYLKNQVIAGQDDIGADLRNLIIQGKKDT